MHPIFIKLQDYLSRANSQKVGMDKEIIVEAAQAFARTLNRHFNEARNENKFTLRMSNVGRPLCQLQMEAAGEKGEAPSYAHKLNMLTGDLLEIVLVAVLKASGVNVEDAQKKVSLPVDDTKIWGTLDLKIDGKVWDAKSASPYAFNNKFRPGYQAVKADDTFGYVAQGQGYAKADNAPFGGWLVINKATGEIEVVEAPEDPREQIEALGKIYSNVRAIRNGVPFKRCFDDEPETFRKKETGNRILNDTCGFCPFKDKCWPGVQHLPSQVGDSKNPRFKWYTHVQKDPKEGQS